MRATGLITCTLLCLAAPAIAQEKDLATQKTEQEIEKLKMEVQKGQLDALTTVRALSGPTATVTTPTDTAEAMNFKYAVYDQAVEKLAIDIKTSGYPEPTIVFGTTPPSISAWLSHEENAKAAARALALATSTWKDSKALKRKVDSGFKAAGVIAALPIISAVVSTLVSAIRVDTTIQGAPLKAEEASLSAMLMNHLRANGYKISFADFMPSRHKAAEADIKTLLDRMIVYDPNTGQRGNLEALRTNALAAYENEFLPQKKALEAELKQAVNANDAGNVARLRAKITAGENLATALGLYNIIKDGLLASTNGVVNATQIVRLREFAEADGNKRPVLYILSKEAALTAVTKKGLFVGWRSTPATLRVGLRIDYLLVGNQPKRGSVTCLSERTKFDLIDASKAGAQAITGNCVAKSEIY